MQSSTYWGGISMHPAWPDEFFSEKDAKFSECEQYRYVLWRKWDESLAPLVFIMLNPSKADATKDDKTISMCCHFARQEGVGGIIVVNLFAFKSTDWKVLLDTPDRVGPENMIWVERVCRNAPRIVVAWGSKPVFHEEISNMAKHLSCFGASVFCLGKTKDGSPKHPSRLPGDTALIPWP